MQRQSGKVRVRPGRETLSDEQIQRAETPAVAPTDEDFNVPREALFSGNPDEVRNASVPEDEGEVAVTPSPAVAAAPAPAEVANIPEAKSIRGLITTMLQQGRNNNDIEAAIKLRFPGTAAAEKSKKHIAFYRSALRKAEKQAAAKAEIQGGVTAPAQETPEPAEEGEIIEAVAVATPEAVVEAAQAVVDAVEVFEQVVEQAENDEQPAM